MLFAHARSFAIACLLAMSSARASVCRDGVIPGGDWIATDGRVISATEGGIIKVDSTWYMWGMDRSKNNSTFEAVVLYKSSDLVHWAFVKQILKKTSNSLLDNGAVVERAKILHNPRTGKFVMWMHYEGHNAYSVAEVAYATADSIDGDFVFQDHFRPLSLDSRDLNVYQDNDGSAYLLCTTKGNQNVSLFSLDTTYTQVVKEVFRGNASDKFACEGHAIVKSGGRYFWIMSWCSGWDFNDNHYYYANSLAGPWTSGGNIAAAGAKTYESQVGWAFPMPGSNGSDFVYMGDRWSVNNFAMSRMVMLPLQISGTAMTLPWYDRWYPNPDSGWSAGEPILPDGVYEIRARHSGKVLQQASAVGSANPQMQQVTESGGASQKWKIENMGGSNFRVTALLSGLRMDVNGASRDSGAQIILYADNGADNQRWHILPSDSGWWRFVDVKTLGKAIQVQNASSADNALVVLGNFSYAPNQEFALVPVNGVVSGTTYDLLAHHSGKAATTQSSDGSVVQMTESGSPSQAFLATSRDHGRFSFQQGGKFLQIVDDSIGNGAGLVLGTDSGLAGQWTVNDIGSGWYTIVNVCSGKSLDVNGGATATADGAPIQQWKYWATTNQQWQLKAVPATGIVSEKSEFVGPVTLHLANDRITLRIQAGSSRIDRVSILSPQGRVVLDDHTPFAGSRSIHSPVPLRGLHLVRLQGDGIDRTLRLMGP